MKPFLVRLREALDRKVAATTPAEKEDAHEAFARLVREAWGRSRRVGERDFARLAANDKDEGGSHE